MTESADVFAKAHQFTRLREVQAMGLYPYFVPVEASGSTEIIINGKRGVMVGSNNYLGFSHDPRVVAAAQDAIARYGTACTGSRFRDGNAELHEGEDHRREVPVLRGSQHLAQRTARHRVHLIELRAAQRALAQQPRLRPFAHAGAETPETLARVRRRHNPPHDRPDALRPGRPAEARRARSHSACARSVGHIWSCRR